MSELGYEQQTWDMRSKWAIDRHAIIVDTEKRRNTTRAHIRTNHFQETVRPVRSVLYWPSWSGRFDDPARGRIIFEMAAVDTALFHGEQAAIKYDEECLENEEAVNHWKRRLIKIEKFVAHLYKLSTEGSQGYLYFGDCDGVVVKDWNAVMQYDLNRYKEVGMSGDDLISDQKWPQPLRQILITIKQEMPMPPLNFEQGVEIVQIFNEVHAKRLQSVAEDDDIIVL